jgi:hypothetical protein
VTVDNDNKVAWYWIAGKRAIFRRRRCLWAVATTGTGARRLACKVEFRVIASGPIWLQVTIRIVASAAVTRYPRHRLSFQQNSSASAVEISISYQCRFRRPAGLSAKRGLCSSNASKTAICPASTPVGFGLLLCPGRTGLALNLPESAPWRRTAAGTRKGIHRTRAASMSGRRVPTGFEKHLSFGPNVELSIDTARCAARCSNLGQELFGNTCRLDVGATETMLRGGTVARGRINSAYAPKPAALPTHPLAAYLADMSGGSLAPASEPIPLAMMPSQAVSVDLPAARGRQ